jgi:hypothetical protein
MKKPILFLLLSLTVLSSCSKKEEVVKPGDSVITHPIAPAKDTVLQEGIDPTHGLLIDRARLRTPEHEKLLERFQPSEVVNIYHDFRPFRKPALKQEEIDAFLEKKKITLEELKAILSEGDLLGWSKQ